MGKIYSLADIRNGRFEMVAEEPVALEPGTPVLHEDRANYRPGFYIGPDPENPESYGRVVNIDRETREGRSIQSVPWSVIQRHAEKAAPYDSVPVGKETLLRTIGEAQRFQADERARRDLEREQIAKRKAEFEAEFTTRCPEWAKGVVVAELEENDCDTQTDYFATKRKGERVILAFLKHDRSLFPTMRKAAASWEPTAHLAEAGKDAEHRENYSMGKGTYLKAGDTWSSGWCVRVHSLKWGSPGVAVFKGTAADHS